MLLIERPGRPVEFVSEAKAYLCADGAWRLYGGAVPYKIHCQGSLDECKTTLANLLRERPDLNPLTAEEKHQVRLVLQGGYVPHRVWNINAVKVALAFGYVFFSEHRMGDCDRLILTEEGSVWINL